MRYLLILLVALCTGCGMALPTIKPYKLEVQQGNVVTSAMLLQLHPGMTKSQVRFIMGTPLIQDSFHGNRWDYVYQLRESGKVIEQRRVILDFENDLLKTVRGDVIAAGSDKSTLNTENIGTRVIKPSAKSEEKSLISKLKFWEKDEADLAKEAAAAKAKLEADEAAKITANAQKKNVMPAEIAPTTSTMPVEALPVKEVEAPITVGEVPVTVVTAIDVPELVVPVASHEVAQVPATPELQAESAPIAPETITSVIEPATKLAPPPPYDSPMGMKFDRTLKLASADVEPTTPPEVTPRAGNKIPPKPKDIPVDSAPSFFDKMLEKIGF